MSEIFVVWAEDENTAQARMEIVTEGEQHRVLRRGEFALVQAEDLDRNSSLDSGDERYCIVFQLG